VLSYAGGAEQKMHKAYGILAESGISPIRIEVQEPTLESLFMEVIGG